MQKSNVGRETFDLVELVRGDQNREFTRLLHEPRDELVAHDRIESGKRLVKD